MNQIHIPFLNKGIHVEVSWEILREVADFVQNLDCECSPERLLARELSRAIEPLWGGGNLGKVVVFNAHASTGLNYEDRGREFPFSDWLSQARGDILVIMCCFQPGLLLTQADKMRERGFTRAFWTNHKETKLIELPI